MLHGAIAAAVTPLSHGASAPDVDAIPSVTSLLAAGGMDGLLALGTTGEGILLTPAERMRVAEAFVSSRPAGFDVAVHAGAQTTAETVALATHATEIGADAVAVIAPPYYPLDADELFAHLLAAATAAGTTPFYVYEFEARSGYAIPPAVVRRLLDSAPNLRGLKVSDSPWRRIEPYLIEGLDVFIGLEPFVARGLAAGAAGAISGLATALPEVIDALVHRRSPKANRTVTRLRAALAEIPFHAAMKAALAHRGLAIHEDVRPPLRTLSAAERHAWIAAVDAASP
jgi:dihydrodipicolinate synthase/N-acetylneuraminate lyase